MRVRKKPVEVEAVLWDGRDIKAVMEFCKSEDVRHFQHDNTIAIATLEGTMFADAGDYIIRGVKGELYPCKPDIFERTYDVL